MRNKIPCSALKIGMFVSDLDRPWIDTPFLFQGFLIENDEHLIQLQQHCKFVVVDSAKSLPRVQTAIYAHTEKSDLNRGDFTPPDFDALHNPKGEGRSPRPDFISTDITLTRFKNIIPVEAELAPADQAYTRTGEVLRDLIQDIRSDKHLALDEVETVIHDVVDSMVRNPDALMLVTRLRQEDEVLYGHGLNVTIYLVALGRHLGLPKEMLERLGTLGLLLDIGKTRLPREILQKKGRLTTAEFDTVKDHVRLSLDILKEMHGLHEDVLQGIAQHHEREDGSGYPLGLCKSEISLFGLMAAIADSFSALTNPRPYAEVIPAYEALQMLGNWSGEFYHASLVEQFIHAIGIFPVGSMVELSSGEVAIVISHIKIRRLKPRVLVISGPDKSPSKSPATLDLLFSSATQETPLTILRGLPTGAYGLNPREYYLS